MTTPIRPGSHAKVRGRRWQKNAKLTEAQVRALHTIHITRGMSMRELARQGWRQWGYASEKSCLVSVCALMDSLGLERRDRVEATVAASTTHGMKSRGNAAYKRWHRETFGPWPSDLRRRTGASGQPASSLPNGAIPCETSATTSPA